jgi:hypothetical protein
MKKIAFISLFSLFSFSLSGQSNQELLTYHHINGYNCDFHFNIEKSYYEVSYNQTFDIRLLNHTNDQVSWKILNKKYKVLSQGIGNNINNHIIQIPGPYKVIFTNLGSHQFSDTASLLVLPYQINIDINNTQFSELPVVGVNASNITFSVPMMVTTFKNKPCDMPLLKLEMGDLIATSSPLNIVSGHHQLLFRLSGTPQYAGPSQIILTQNQQNLVFTFNILPSKN